MLLLLGDGTQVAVSEPPGDGPWMFLVLQADPGALGPEAGGAAGALTRFGRAVLVGLDELARVARRAAADQPWAWRAPVLVQDADPSSAPGMAALERLLGRLGGGPGWAGIAPDAPPR